MPVATNPLVTGIPFGIQRTIKTVTFTGAAGLGAVGTGNIFTVTGEVFITHLTAFCSTNIGVDAGSGTASMQWGYTGATNGIIATTTATAIDANEWWHSNTPTASVSFIGGQNNYLGVATTVDIVFEVTSSGTQLVNAGVITWTALWYPLSADGSVTPA